MRTGHDFEIDQVDDGGRPARAAWTVRVAGWSARHRWRVVGAWFALTLGLFAGSLMLGGIKALNANGGAGGTQTETARAYQALNAGGSSQPAGETMTVVVTSATQRATGQAFRASVEAIEARLKSVTAVVDGAKGPAVAAIEDPYSAPASSESIAPDGTSVQVNAQIAGNSSARQTRVAALEPAITSIQAAYPGYSIHALDDTLTNDQINSVVNGDLDGALRISLPATFLILLLAFGALVAATVPLILAISALLGAFGLLGLYSQAVGGVSPYAAQIVVLIGLAVAVDYSLFMVSRFRAERAHGRDRYDAIEVASATAGRAVLFSGVAVMISLAGLFLLPGSFFQSMALGAIAVILVSVVGSLTFIPAVLAILDRKLDRGRIPFVSRRPAEGTGFWARLTRGVVARPLISAVTAAAVLLALAVPVLSLRLGETDLSSFPPVVDGVQALDALQAHWPQGTRLNLLVVVTGSDQPGVKAAIGNLERSALAIPGLSGPPVVETRPIGNVTSVSFVMSGTQNDPANWDIVKRVRESVVPSTFGSLPSVSALVAGDAAQSLDNTQVYTDGLARIFVFVLGLSFLLLMLVFRSIAIPLEAIALNLLSTAAACGVVVVVFEKGLLAGPLGIQPTEAIQNWVPVFIFTILFGLSMDYEVFILSRIKEFRDRGFSSHEAVARGISIASGTVTSAAAIMVVVFAVFVTLRLEVIRELGLGLAVAIFIDATIVRSVLLPATMRLLGDRNWYLPSVLGWLPRLRIEGEPDESPAPELAEDAA